MFKTVKMLAVAFAMVALVAVASARADDKKKEVTLKGDICCAKCELKLQKTCATVIRIKDNGKDVVYYLDDKSAKDNHKAICTESKEGSVTGVVSEKDGKKIITASKVEFKKDKK